MNVSYEEKDKLLLLEITEEIDHHTSEKIRRKADYEITRYMPRKIVFDFHHVTFMDSAGIGMVLGRYKLMKMLGGNEWNYKNMSIKRNVSFGTFPKETLKKE